MVCFCGPFPIPCFCFPPTAQILTSIGHVLIKDLNQDHKLVTVARNGALKITEFFTYLHFDPDLTAEFLVVTCDNGAQLVITGGHLLFKMAEEKIKTVRASNIAVGEKLVYLDQQEGRTSYPKVIQISMITMKGVFAPLSGSGTLIVDGFKTSCYAEVDSHSMAHQLMAPLKIWYRMMEFKNGKLGKKNKKHSTIGIHSYAKLLENIRKKIHH